MLCSRISLEEFSDCGEARVLEGCIPQQGSLQVCETCWSFCTALWQWLSMQLGLHGSSATVWKSDFQMVASLSNVSFGKLSFSQRYGNCALCNWAPCKWLGCICSLSHLQIISHFNTQVGRRLIGTNSLNLKHLSRGLHPKFSDCVGARVPESCITQQCSFEISRHVGASVSAMAMAVSIATGARWKRLGCIFSFSNSASWCYISSPTAARERG